MGRIWGFAGIERLSVLLSEAADAAAPGAEFFIVEGGGGEPIRVVARGRVKDRPLDPPGRDGQPFRDW